MLEATHTAPIYDERSAELLGFCAYDDFNQHQLFMIKCHGYNDKRINVRLRSNVNNAVLTKKYNTCLPVIYLVDLKSEYLEDDAAVVKEFLKLGV